MLLGPILFKIRNLLVNMFKVDYNKGLLGYLHQHWTGKIIEDQTYSCWPWTKGIRVIRSDQSGVNVWTNANTE